MSEQDANSTMSDAEKMRLKRLARLGAPQPARTASPDQPSDTNSQPARSETSTPAASSASSRLLSATLPQTQPEASSSKPIARKATPPKETVSSSLGKRRPSQPREAPSTRTVSTPPVKDQLTQPNQPYHKWEQRTIGHVLSVALKREEAESSDWRLCWLKDLEKELKEEGASTDISPEIADRLLVARLQMEPDVLAKSDDPDYLTILAGLPQDETVFEYLTGCWKRLYASNKQFGRLAYSQADKSTWQTTFDKLKALVISYCGLTLEDPTMFPQPANRPTGPAEFLPVLLALTPSGTGGDPFSSSSSAPSRPAKMSLDPSDLTPFLNDLAAGTKDVLSDVLTPTFSLFFQEWFKITPTPDIMGQDWRQYLGAVATLVQVKNIAALLPFLSVWVASDVTAPRIEWQSLLGPLTRLSVYPREFAQIWKTYFSEPTERKVADIDANKSNLRHTLNSLQTTLYQIYNSIVRGSPEAREGVLSFFAQVVQLNARRSGMRVQSSTVSSDGYMTNLQVILLKLFEPVMDVSFSKIDKIDVDYFRNSSRIDISEETRIKATKEQVDEYTGMDVDKTTPNFISDIFFLLGAFQHLGLIKTISTRKQAETSMRDMEKELKRTEASRGDWAGNPALEAQGEAAIKKLKGDVATLHASIHAYDTQLLDPTLTRLVLDYVGFLMTWLIRLVDPKHQHPQVPIQLPLPEEAPQQFSMLPEYLIENIAEYLDFLSHYNPEALEDADKDIVVTFAIVFLTPGYVNNPFLKAKLISTIASGLYPVGYFRHGTLFDRLGVNEISTTYLMPTVIRFFIDVEHTGGHTQFWDKFTFRRDMSRIIKSMWGNPLHREAFVKARHDDFDQFIKFINMLMSDTTFHLEESLTSLAKVNAIRTQQADEAGWTALPDSERQDLQSQLASAERQAPFHTQMGLDHVELIRDLSATTKEPFTVAEIVDRLAATLDENLTSLVGPKMQELRVTDPKKFAFEPKRLLAGIAQIYLNLAEEGDFIRAVANDGRSYSKDLFERFARILKHRAIMTEAEVAEVVAFTQRVEDMKATIMIEDEREIPDEFLDPLLSTLMKDPVILPVSRQVVDRSTIRTVLLSGDKDPFNNVPLKLEDCVPDDELRAKIDAWVAEGKNTQAAQVMDVETL